jgi:hypothetical protein
MVEDKNIYDVDTQVLKDKIKQWRSDYVDSINSLDGSLLDHRVVATFIKGQINDTQVLMQWCEILAHKVKQLENKQSPTNPSKEELTKGESVTPSLPDSA